MQPIQMVDLQGQYQKIEDEVQSGMNQIIHSAHFINGPQVKEFARDLSAYLGGAHVIPCGNGTDAIQIALMALELKPGDEVITTPFTFVATAEVIALLGLKPVFVDINPYTFNLDETQIEQKITARTKCIIPVHLFGQCADMEPIMRIAKNYNLKVIEDNAQSIGADYTFSSGETKKSGTIGDIGTTSFFPSKNLGAYGDGGAVITNDSALVERIRSICNHGSKVKYYHDHIGVNSRLDTLQAHVLKVKLKYLDSYNDQRRKAADRYDAYFAEVKKVETPFRVSYSTHVFHQYSIKVPASSRDQLAEVLKEKDIPFGIYYPVPLHLQNAYQHYGYEKGDFPVSERVARCILSLPMHTELTDDQQEFIAEQVKGVYA